MRVGFGTASRQQECDRCDALSSGARPPNVLAGLAKATGVSKRMVIIETDDLERPDVRQRVVDSC
jgi:hypothetical protein